MHCFDMLCYNYCRTYDRNQSSKFNVLNSINHSSSNNPRSQQMRDHAASLPGPMAGAPMDMYADAMAGPKGQNMAGIDVMGASAGPSMASAISGPAAASSSSS